MSFDDRFLKNGTDFTFNVNESVTWTHGVHTVKGGIDGYRVREYEGERSIFSRALSVLPKDTLTIRWTVTGRSRTRRWVTMTLIRNRTRAMGRTSGNPSWNGSCRTRGRSPSRLTLDYGIRFTWANQMYPHYAGQQAVLALALYNAAQAPVLFSSR